MIAILILLSSFSSSAQDSSHIRISLLTCTPGDELYSIFGHSAIRVIDSSSVEDNVFNYGTFNFDDKNFYLKFARGKLLYFISTEPFADFQFMYRATGREITEQVLNLSALEKINLYHKLLNNLKEENKYYQYDFFFDNCTTRLRDLIVESKHPKPELPAVQPLNTSFRNAIHIYLDSGKQYWSKLGIDILLGARTDRKMTAAEQQFLPDNLMFAVDSQGPMLVQSTKKLYKLDLDPQTEPWFTPMRFSIGLLLIFVLLSRSKNRHIKSLMNGLDGLFFFLVGLLGWILLFMWFYTDHSMTKDNYNLIWAWPTHILAAFFVGSRKKIIHTYWMITMVGLSIVMMAWFFLPQAMNPALIPIVLLLIYRSAMRFFETAPLK